MPESPVRELRLAYTVEDYDGAVRFYRDALGLPVIQEWEQPAGSGAILDAGPVRLELEVEDSEEAASALASAGAQKIGGPVVTPWSHKNVRLRAPDGMQLTLFTVL